MSFPSLRLQIPLDGPQTPLVGLQASRAGPQTPLCKGQELASPSQRGDTANVPGVSRNVHARASVCT